MMVESIAIGASPDDVYTLISDPIRMGEWSPECVRCRWIGGADGPSVGARFRGTSRNGRRRWTTTSEITDIVPARRFAWEVTYFGRPVAAWEYRVESEGEGTLLSEGVEDRRGSILRTLSPFITGSRDRATRNASTMTSTLEAIKVAAEQPR